MLRWSASIVIERASMYLYHKYHNTVDSTISSDHTYDCWKQQLFDILDGASCELCVLGDLRRRIVKTVCSLLPRDVEQSWIDATILELYGCCTSFVFEQSHVDTCNHVHACDCKAHVHIAKHVCVLHSKFLCNLIIRFHIILEAEKAHLQWFRNFEKPYKVFKIRLAFNTTLVIG